MYETEVVVRLAREVLVPVFGHVRLGPDYTRLVAGIEGLEAVRIGIGSKSTFHGVPDIELEGLQCIFGNIVREGEEEEEIENESTSSGYSSKNSVPLMLLVVLHMLRGKGL